MNEQRNDHLDAHRLQELLEGEAAPGGATARHLEECGECRALLEGSRRLRREARGLVPEVPLSRDLWPGIEARIRERGGGTPVGDAGRLRVSPRRGPGTHRGGPTRRWPTPSWMPGLAAAAAVAVLFAGSLLLTDGGEAPAGGDQVAAGEATSAHLASEVREIEEAYGPAIEELRGLVESRELAPETRAVLEENLAVIDRAITESREAVEADPGAPRAVESLRRMYDAKVGVLRAVARN